ncbi:MAG: glycosyltransferase [Acholeplasmatales bacterium]|nr:glycosyltransferase [Acholeplasmatales bacterium]
MSAKSNCARSWIVNINLQVGTTHIIKVVPTCKLIFTIHDLAQFDLALINKSNKYEKYYLSGFKGFIRYSLKFIARLTRYWHHKMYKILKKNIDSAYKIIAVSNSTKEDIIKRFKCDPSKINVCYSPIKFSEKGVSKFDYSNYFLFVSASRYTKNAVNAIKAFDKYIDVTKSNAKFIITGNLPKKVLKISKNKDLIINMPYLESADLEYLYEHANALIFTSFYEGFGMPPLEAMKYGTKVICSNIPCLKEIYKHALFANPYKVLSIAYAMVTLDTISKEDMLADYSEIKKKCEEGLSLHKDIIYN